MPAGRVRSSPCPCVGLVPTHGPASGASLMKHRAAAALATDLRPQRSFENASSAVSRTRARRPELRRTVGRWAGVARLRGPLVMLAFVLLGFASVGNPAEALGLATALVVGAVFVLLARPAPAGEPLVWVRARVLRQHAARSTFMRSRDPDAAGRVRPRA